MDITPEQYQEVAKDGMLALAGSGLTYNYLKKPASYLKNKLSGPSKSDVKTRNDSIGEHDNSSTEDTVPKKHSNSFQGEKRNLGGGRTQAYQSYLDSVAQNKAKVKLNRRAG